MIVAAGFGSIWLACYKIDFRRGHGSLLAETYGLGLNPLEGDTLLFIARDKRKMKIIYSDPTGLWVSYKVFHKSAMKTLIEFASAGSKLSMTAAELAMLLEGAAFTVHKRVKPFVKKDD